MTNYDDSNKYLYKVMKTPSGSMLETKKQVLNELPKQNKILQDYLN